MSRDKKISRLDFTAAQIQCLAEEVISLYDRAATRDEEKPLPTWLIASANVS
jgi:hypothetical protein